MRTILYMLIVASLISCDDSAELQMRNVSFLIDRTETQISYPSGQFLLDRFPNRDPNDGIQLCFATIGDTPFVDAQCFVLEKGKTGIWANESERRREIRLLESSFIDSLAIENNKEHHFERSDIFRVVVAELKRLSSQDGSKELWLFSDLKEHSFFSVYNANDKHRLFNDLEGLAGRFKNEVNLSENFEGIHLRIAHSPSQEDTALFSQMIRLYRMILEPQGVRISIGLDNQINLSR